MGWQEAGQEAGCARVCAKKGPVGENAPQNASEEAAMARIDGELPS